MSSFSAKCSRLSQYLKEQQRLAAGPATTLSLLPGLEPSPVDETSIQAMDLFPQHAGFDVVTLPVEEKAQLSIFYNGRMLVIDDFPADKANDIMAMAGKVESFTSTPSCVPDEGKGLPMTRRDSLHRFMEKRRERIRNSKAPYRVCGSKTDSSMDSSNISWLFKSPKLELKSDR